jgi:hypothetical protein
VVRPPPAIRSHLLGAPGRWPWLLRLRALLNHVARAGARLGGRRRSAAAHPSIATRGRAPGTEGTPDACVPPRAPPATAIPGTARRGGSGRTPAGARHALGEGAFSSEDFPESIVASRRAVAPRGAGRGRGRELGVCRRLRLRGLRWREGLERDGRGGGVGGAAACWRCQHRMPAGRPRGDLGCILGELLRDGPDTPHVVPIC